MQLLLKENWSDTPPEQPQTDEVQTEGSEKVATEGE